MKSGQRVQTSLALGVRMPEIASMTEDLPDDCSPTLLSAGLKRIQRGALTKNHTAWNRYVKSSKPQLFKSAEDCYHVVDMRTKHMSFSSALG